METNPLRSNRTVFIVSNGRPENPKLTFKVNGLWIKVKAQIFASLVFSKHTFKIWRKKRKWFSLSPGHFKLLNYASIQKRTYINFMHAQIWLTSWSVKSSLKVTHPFKLQLLGFWVTGFASLEVRVRCKLHLPLCQKWSWSDRKATSATRHYVSIITISMYLIEYNPRHVSLTAILVRKMFRLLPVAFSFLDSL